MNRQTTHVRTRDLASAAAICALFSWVFFQCGMFPFFMMVLSHALPSPDPATWTQLEKTKIEIDSDGVYTAAPPPDISAMVGKPFEITGFAIPIDDSELTKHFMVTRYPPTCPFCPPGSPNQTVEVYTHQPKRLVFDLMTVRGRFSLQNKMPGGLFYRVDDAETPS